MKELSSEQKAKAYDEALEKFKAILNLSTVKESGTIFVYDVRKVFPELKESEDEKISKELIGFVKSRPAGFPQCERFIAWLKKQGDIIKEE